MQDTTQRRGFAYLGFPALARLDELLFRGLGRLGRGPQTQAMMARNELDRLHHTAITHGTEEGQQLVSGVRCRGGGGS